jgi:hypothetical protein
VNPASGSCTIGLVSRSLGYREVAEPSGGGASWKEVRSLGVWP